MRAGKLLLTAGFLFGLTVAANGAGTVTDSDFADSTITLSIIDPLEVTVGNITFGDYLSTTSSIAEETAAITVTGSGDNKVTLALSKTEVELKNSDDKTIVVALKLGTDTTGSKSNLDISSGTITDTLVAYINPANSGNSKNTEDNLIAGNYTGTVTVTATYE